ncbi:MAG TPA: hypothetical protein VFQ77_20155 [Pseudonocardiaceae bacterium]|jgi:hypothetical protein|nr:hypothetical protein [Pseudonocardiaceae bacterium]
MATTTVRIDSRTRDRLATVARQDFGGVSHEAALNRLIDEHEMQQVHAAYARLRNHPDQWADYQQELRLTENSAADGLCSARDEYPEYNQ